MEVENKKLKLRAPQSQWKSMLIVALSLLILLSLFQNCTRAKSVQESPSAPAPEVRFE